jgi:hypothetical protein
MNSNFLIKSRGYNTDSGLIYRNCGLSQMGLKPNFGKIGLDIYNYENAKNEKELLENLNSVTEPNFFEGKDKDLKQEKPQVYYQVPKEEIGGNTQSFYASKPDVNTGQPPAPPPMEKDVYIPVDKNGNIPQPE